MIIMKSLLMNRSREYEASHNDNNENKIKKLKSFRSNEHIYEKGVGPYRGFGYFSLVSDPIELAIWSQKRITVILHQRVSR